MGEPAGKFASPLRILHVVTLLTIWLGISRRKSIGAAESILSRFSDPTRRPLVIKFPPPRLPESTRGKPPLRCQIRRNCLPR